MKAMLNKITVSLLVIVMLLVVMTPIYAFDTKKANNESFVVKYNEADSTYDKSKRTFTLYFDIPKEAANYDSIKIDLSGGMVDGINSSLQMPGDSFSFDINIRNESGADFSYKKGSYFLKDSKMNGPENIYGIKSFSGATVDEKLVPYRISSSKAIYSGLFDKKYSSSVTGLEMAKIDTYLAAKGYTGDEALTNYLLKYYNDANGTNATKISELPSSALSSIFSTGISNSTYRISDADYATLTEAQKSSIVGTTNKNMYKFRETEKQLSEYYYNYFYDWCIGFVMGKHVSSADSTGNIENRLVSTSSIVKVYNNVNGVKDVQESYITKTLTDERMENGQTATLLAGYVVDAPLTGNNAANYSFGFESAIELEKTISFGDVIISKTLDLNGYSYNDQPTFIFKLTDTNGVEYYKTITFKEGQTSQSIKFDNIPLGKYSIEEVDTIRYEQVGLLLKVGTLTKTNASQTVLITNKKEKNNDFSDTNIVVNSFKKTSNGIEISQNNQGTQE